MVEGSPHGPPSPDATRAWHLPLEHHAVFAQSSSVAHVPPTACLGTHCPLAPSQNESPGEQCRSSAQEIASHVSKRGPAHGAPAAAGVTQKPKLTGRPPEGCGVHTIPDPAAQPHPSNVLHAAPASTGKANGGDASASAGEDDGDDEVVQAVNAIKTPTTDDAEARTDAKTAKRRRMFEPTYTPRRMDDTCPEVARRRGGDSSSTRRATMCSPLVCRVLERHADSEGSASGSHWNRELRRRLVRPAAT